MGVAEPDLTVCLSARQVAEKANLQRLSLPAQLLTLFPARVDTHAVLLLAPRRTKCFIEIPMTA